jgi:hypothetical protein
MKWLTLAGIFLVAIALADAASAPYFLAPDYELVSNVVD